MVTTPSSNLRGETGFSPASQRLFSTLAEAIGKDARKADKLAAERRAAVAALVDDWLEVQDAPTRAAFFAFIEGKASASQRKKIETHPLRLEGFGLIAAKPAAGNAEPVNKPATRIIEG
ncbi:MAG TPA: hypothetical protein PLI43_20065 [Albidovulum sp.]|uniref:hypothetical protein n=1 Tax=Albidovulum sp. TaxID=1872424 RepID=UPI002CCC88A3|nr:hypothetical protein [Albidovulum sp.]